MGLQRIFSLEVLCFLKVWRAYDNWPSCTDSQKIPLKDSREGVGWMLICPRCGQANARKNGFVRKQQRFKCRSCGYNFTTRNKRDFPDFLKALVALSVNNTEIEESYGGQGKLKKLVLFSELLGIDRDVLLRWVRAQKRQAVRQLKTINYYDRPPVVILNFGEFEIQLHPTPDRRQRGYL
jgi:predicted RNA-binding Zn-ribbon protein involved in translation (DUF1610 family)